MNKFLTSSQKGFAPILLIVAVVGVLVFVLVTGVAPFRDKLFASLFQKNSSFAAGGPAISNIVIGSPSVNVYDKEEIKFDIASNTQYPYTPYDTNPPPGVTPGIGISVDGVFTTNGKTWKQPAFYITETVKNGNGASMYFTETGKKYWMLRFSPQETGNYQVTINVTDASGTSSISAGSFTANPPTKKGFIKVSQTDKRYFEYSNGDLFFPIGPAHGNGNSYSQYKNMGPNLERPWLGGRGIYSTNWARWKSSAENLGNEGIMTRLNFQEKYPGHDLSYELFYPEGYRFWLSTWLDSIAGPRITSGKKYTVKLVYKTANLAGPRVAGQPFGLVAKMSDYAPWGNPPIDAVETSLRSTSTQILVPNITSNQNWTTLNTTFTANANRDQIYVYLDNVTAGQSYIDEFSIRECLDTGCTNLGGEVIRNPRADEHMFIEQRPAAFTDWEVEQGELNDVYFKYVVHDKNDWIQAHLKADGTWASQGDGYNQPDGTKARWLLKQWYRYLIARWGYSTAIHSWELLNEDAPNEFPLGSGTSPHWKQAQEFGKYMHDNDAHRHLTTTSFWCCWRPKFWGNNTLFPDIDYADLHMYTSNTDSIAPATETDMAAWDYNTSLSIFNNGYPSGQKGVGKPVIRAETGISGSYPTLQQPNAGIWYHNLLWPELNEGAMFDTGYWFSAQLDQINQTAITKPFADFVKKLDLNKGGYVGIGATVSNTNLRAIGQKNLTFNKAVFWVQNSTHTWINVMNNAVTNQSGVITFQMKPSQTYTVETWNTYNGTLIGTQSLQSNGNGDLSLTVTNLSDDFAVNVIGPAPLISPSPTATPAASVIVSSPISTPSPLKPGDIDGNGKVDIFDYNILLTNFGKTGNGIQGDLNGSGKVDIFDYNILLTNFGK